MSDENQQTKVDEVQAEKGNQVKIQELQEKVESVLTLKKVYIAEKCKQLLQGSGVMPMEMHAVLWNWSRNNFLPGI